MSEDTRKFGEKSEEFQTVFTLFFIDSSVDVEEEDQAGVIGVYNEMDSLMASLHENKQVDEELGNENISYYIQQHDIRD